MKYIETNITLTNKFFTRCLREQHCSVVPFLPYNKVRYWDPYVLPFAFGEWASMRQNRFDIANIFRYDVNTRNVNREMYPQDYVEDGIRIIYKITLWGGDEGVSDKFQYDVLNNQQIFGIDLFQMKNLNFYDEIRNDYHHGGDRVLRNIMLRLYQQRIEPNVVVQYFDNAVTWSEIFVSFDINSFIYKHNANTNHKQNNFYIIGIPSGN